MKPVFLAIAAVIPIAAFVGCDSKKPPSDSSLSVQPVFAEEGASLDQKRRILDEAVLNALKSAGADLTLPHSIEHHFRANSQAKIDQLSARGKEIGFTAKQVSAPGNEIGLDLIKEQLPVIEGITPDSVAMERLASELGVTYEGWGCDASTGLSISVAPAGLGALLLLPRAALATRACPRLVYAGPLALNFIR